MITYEVGNLLLSDAQALVNTVNTEGVMGKGIALQFKEEFQNNYEIYRRACKTGNFSIGEVLITEDYNRVGEKKIIVNFPTKTTWRKPSEYTYIGLGLHALKKKIEELHIMSIAIPPLGANNGGLDWQKVKEMIIMVLGDMDCDIRLYEPSDAIIEKMKAEKPKMTPARAMLLTLMCDMVANGEYMSEFAAEKGIYFLQNFGAEDIFKVKFKKGIYGPYSEGKIKHFLYNLNGGYFKGMGAMENKPLQRLWLLPDTASIVDEYMNAKENEKYKQIVEKTKAFLTSYYSDYSLELLATVDYLFRNDPTFEGWSKKDDDSVVELVKMGLHNWSTRKEKKFNEDFYIKKVVGHLREMHDAGMTGEQVSDMNDG